MSAKRVAREVALWIPTVLLALMFLNAGLRKFPETGGWTRMFHNVGFPDWFRYLIGVLETLAAVLILIPRTAAYGAMTIIVIMIGAIGVNTSQHFPIQGVITAAVCLLAAAVILVARFGRRIRVAGWMPERAL